MAEYIKIPTMQKRKKKKKNKMAPCLCWMPSMGTWEVQ